MSVSVVQFRSVGHEPGFEAWCDECGSVAELTVPLSADGEAVEAARADVDRAALLHEDNDHAPIAWVDDEPIVVSS